MKKKICLLVLCLFVPQFLFAAEIKLGLMCPLTGSWASEGQDMQKIVSLLVDDINAAGGINDDTINLIVEDDGGDPRTASLAAQKLISSGVLAIIGTYGSAVTEASQNIIDEAEIIQIATGSTSIRLTEKGLQYFFRTCPRDDEQGKVAAKYIVNQELSSVAILHDNSSYSKGLAEETNALLKDAGVNIVFFDALTPKERDYSAILTKLQAAKPELILFTGYYPEAGLLLRQKQEMGFLAPMMGGDAVNNTDLVHIAGKEAAKGFIFLSPPVPQDIPTPLGKAFLTSYISKYNTQPQSVWAVLAGDAFLVIAEALKNAPHESAALAKYIKEDLKDYDVITGKLSFNAKGDRVGDLYQLYEVQEDGSFQIKQ